MADSNPHDPEPSEHASVDLDAPDAADDMRSVADVTGAADETAGAADEVPGAADEPPGADESSIDPPPPADERPPPVDEAHSMIVALPPAPDGWDRWRGADLPDAPPPPPPPPADQWPLASGDGAGSASGDRTPDERSGRAPDYGRLNGWDAMYPVFVAPEIPSYVGPVTYCKRELVEDRDELARRRPDVAIVGAPFDDAVSYRPGARFGPRAVREATYNSSWYSLQLDIEPFEHLDVVDAGDANIVPAWLSRGHAMIFRKVLEVASSGAIPIVVGGDHSITWPSASAIAQLRAPGRIGIVHFDAHADTANQDWGVLAGHGTPMRRLIESGAVDGRNFVQVGLRGYWPPPDAFAWMREHGMRWHLMREIEERGAEAVIDDAIAEALEGPEAVYLSIDIDVIDPGMAPGTGTPEPGGMLTREVLRAVRRIVGAVELAGMDVVEVSPPYDHAEVTSMAAHRTILEAISALAVRKRDGGTIRFDAARPTHLRDGPVMSRTGGTA